VNCELSEVKAAKDQLANECGGAESGDVRSSRGGVNAAEVGGKTAKNVLNRRDSVKDQPETNTEATGAAKIDDFSECKSFFESLKSRQDKRRKARNFIIMGVGAAVLCASCIALLATNFPVLCAFLGPLAQILLGINIGLEGITFGLFASEVVDGLRVLGSPSNSPIFYFDRENVEKIIGYCDEKIESIKRNFEILNIFVTALAKLNKLKLRNFSEEITKDSKRSMILLQEARKFCEENSGDYEKERFEEIKEEHKENFFWKDLSYEKFLKSVNALDQNSLIFLKQLGEIKFFLEGLRRDFKDSAEESGSNAKENEWKSKYISAKICNFLVSKEKSLDFIYEVFQKIGLFPHEISQSGDPDKTFEMEQVADELREPINS
jgi:hypothetical protein